KTPSPSGAISTTQNQPSATGSASNGAPSSAAGSKTTSRGAPPPPHTSPTPPKPPTSNPPPSNVAPAAPTGAAVSVNWATDNPNDYATTFTWAPVNGATSYDVHYTFTDGNGHQKYDQIYNAAGTSFRGPNEFSDPSSLACFQVRAVNAYGTSAWDSGSPHCA
ncbi:hypothetical protein KGQ20_45250, partial [Catenulispora sp. NF23]|nr:hypothetical protein [Catenulispora pinistramenti]